MTSNLALQIHHLSPRFSKLSPRMLLLSSHISSKYRYDLAARFFPLFRLIKRVETGYSAVVDNDNKLKADKKGTLKRRYTKEKVHWIVDRCEPLQPIIATRYFVTVNFEGTEERESNKVRVVLKLSLASSRARRILAYTILSELSLEILFISLILGIVYMLRKPNFGHLETSPLP